MEIIEHHELMYKKYNIDRLGLKRLLATIGNTNINCRSSPLVRMFGVALKV
jgi:hypothetical protein